MTQEAISRLIYRYSPAKSIEGYQESIINEQRRNVYTRLHEMTAGKGWCSDA